MRSFFEWFRASGLSERVWLLLGKGPTFAARHACDLSAFATFGLNHVCREMPVDVAHAIDLDVIDQCGDALIARAGVLVMPWHPHVPDTRRPDWIPRRAVRVSERTLEDLAREHAVLRRLAAEDRLLWYNSSTAPVARPESPIVPVRYFSAVAAINLLGMAGARTVRSLGIDGGTEYSPEFADLADVTRLAGGQGTFDRQFTEIARALVRTGLSYAPLGRFVGDVGRASWSAMNVPIRVFVGATEPQQLAVRVLEYSIRARTPMDVEVMPLYRTGLPIPQPREPRNRGRTPFSFQRFLIPAAAGRRGRAIYLDSDMLVLADLREIWQLPFDEAPVLAIRTQATDPTARFSVLLLDCAALGWSIDEIVAALDADTLTYQQLMYELCVPVGKPVDGPAAGEAETSAAGEITRVAGVIDPRWNSLDRYEEGRTALLHYTDGPRQPWVSTEHPLGYLWMRELFAAIDAGFISEAEIDEAVRAGHVRPSLRVQVRERLEDPLLLPRGVRRQDLFFVEPFRLRAGAPTPPLERAAAVARAAARRAYRHSALFRMRQWLAERW